MTEVPDKIPERPLTLGESDELLKDSDKLRKEIESFKEEYLKKRKFEMEAEMTKQLAIFKEQAAV
jgi:hypothetical protein